MGRYGMIGSFWGTGANIEDLPALLPEQDELFLLLPHAEETLTPARMGRLGIPLDAHPSYPVEKPVHVCPVHHHQHRRPHPGYRRKKES